jgi:uncharacterized protein (TIGR03435 family)
LTAACGNSCESWSHESPSHAPIHGTFGLAVIVLREDSYANRKPLLWQPLSSLSVTLLCGAIGLLNSLVSQAQTADLRPEFEVASIKPNSTNERMYFGLHGVNLLVRNISVKGLIQIAYGKRDFQITGGPGWITSECFDIDAKAESPAKATHDMLKSLLASRFKLELHRETKNASVYSLVVARGGLKMKRSADQTEPERGGPKELRAGRILGEGIPMYVLTNLLSNALGRAVINNTGLTGKYDVDLQYFPDSVQPSGAGDELAAADVLDIAIFTAVEKQLGLKLAPTKALQEVLVVDRVEHPSTN